MEAGRHDEKFASWRDQCLSGENNNKDGQGKKEEAHEYFRMNVCTPHCHSKSYEDSLARLLQTLGPALTSRLSCRFCSMSLLLGALECCHSSTKERGKLGLPTAKLLSSFFIEQCRPYDDDDDISAGDGADFGEKIRDLSMKCLSSLMETRFDIGRDDSSAFVDAIKHVCTVSQQGVETRCALSPDDCLSDFGTRNVTGGLSVLPRSRRSLCFELLQSTVNGIDDKLANASDTVVTATLAAQVEADLNSFVKFSCSCLQGESDPRCLMQLLVLFRRIQLVFKPFYLYGNRSSFPITDMFDAVAPYYPINFTPPPHDNHGVTRSGLRHSLMMVLCDFEYDKLASANMSNTFSNLSLGLVLERLIPLDGDDSNLAVTTAEKREALVDLSMLFSEKSQIMLEGLSEGSMQQLSNALIFTHHNAAAAVARGDPNADEERSLADSCHSFIADLACRLESIKDKSLWSAFVKNPVADMSSKLDSASDEGRVSIAYLAALPASGGIETLRCVLHSGLGVLITTLENRKNDEDLATIAAYGIGAFFSVCHVATEKAKGNRLVLHPHPAEKYCQKAFSSLSTVLLGTKDHPVSFSLQTASLMALESLLSVYDSNQMGDVDRSKICEIIDRLEAVVINETETIQLSQDKACFIFAETSARTLGFFLGKAISKADQKPTEAVDTILESDPIRSLLRGKVMIELLYKAKQASKGSEEFRFDRMCLSRASSVDIASAEIIIESLLCALQDSLVTETWMQQSSDCADAVSILLQKGGEVATRAFHDLAPPNVTVYDVLDKLCDLDPRSASGSLNTALKLPAPVDEHEAIQLMIQTILDKLLPAFRKGVPEKRVLVLASQVSKILPPLSNADIVRLSIYLPLLSAALQNEKLPSTTTKDEKTAQNRLKGQLNSMTRDLATYALSQDYDAKSRAAAASCLHACLTDYSPISSQCPARQIISDVLVAPLASAIDVLLENQTGQTQAMKLIDCLNLCSVVGSAAAWIGGQSTHTADTLSSLFVQLACTGSCQIPYYHNTQQKDGILAVADTSLSILIATNAATAFGSLLRIRDSRPLWKQRIIHNALKLLEPILSAEEKMVNQPIPVKTGLIAVLSHIICSGSLKSITSLKQGMMLKQIIDSLSSGPFASDSKLNMMQEVQEVKRISISALLRLASSSPGLLFNYIEAVVMALLTTYASTQSSDLLSDIPTKLLTLQTMERLCHMEMKRKALLVLKPAVVSMLGTAMNHPSRLLREAAVTVRNTWFTLE